MSVSPDYPIHYKRIDFTSRYGPRLVSKEQVESMVYENWSTWIYTESKEEVYFTQNPIFQGYFTMLVKFHEWGMLFENRISEDFSIDLVYPDLFSSPYWSGNRKEAYDPDRACLFNMLMASEPLWI